jgi:hypothetical protein
VSSLAGTRPEVPVSAHEVPGTDGATPAVDESPAVRSQSPAGRSRPPFGTVPSGTSPGAPDDEPDDDYDDDDPRPQGRSYTWLHLIALAVVAFVLGFLLFALWKQGRSDGADASALALVVHTLVTSAPPVAG